MPSQEPMPHYSEDSEPKPPRRFWERFGILLLALGVGYVIFSLCLGWRPDKVIKIKRIFTTAESLRITEITFDNAGLFRDKLAEPNKRLDSANYEMTRTVLCTDRQTIEHFVDSLDYRHSLKATLLSRPKFTIEAYRKGVLTARMQIKEMDGGDVLLDVDGSRDDLRYVMGPDFERALLRLMGTGQPMADEAK